MTPPERNAQRLDLHSQFARRIREVRLISHGESGIPTLAEDLGLPHRTWQNYEDGVTMPDLVLLKFIRATGVCPGWLLTGEGDKFGGRRLGVAGYRTSSTLWSPSASGTSIVTA